MHIHCSTLNWDIRLTGVKQPCTWIVPTDSFPRFAILVVPQVRSYAMAMVRGVMGAPGPSLPDSHRLSLSFPASFAVLSCHPARRNRIKPARLLACHLNTRNEFADEDELRAFVADRNERRDITSGGGPWATPSCSPKPRGPGGEIKSQIGLKL